MNQLYRNVLPKLNDQTLPAVLHCHLLNISQCGVTEDASQFVVNVYNSLTKSIDKYVRIPVREGFDFKVVDPEGKAMYSISTRHDYENQNYLIYRKIYSDAIGTDSGICLVNSGQGEQRCDGIGLPGCPASSFGCQKLSR